MISAVELQNFKGFERVHVPARPLTLLTGVNGTGKSSVIQALALLRQSALERLLPGGLLLNGPLVRLGTARDVLCEFADQDVVHFALHDSTSSSRWSFDASELDADFLPMVDGSALQPDLPLFRPGVLHLSAERVGPRIVYPMSSLEVRTHESFLSDGSLAAAWFHLHQGEEVAEPLRHPAAASINLREQAHAWMGEISPGVRFTVAANDRLQQAELAFQFVAPGISARSFRPTGVGFGLSYTLPVVLACLAARQERLVLLENPEAHLHPRGQMAMGELAARAAAAGAQLVLETHSDHLLNGVRLAVKDGLLAPDQVAIHFFTREQRDGKLTNEVQSPRIDEHGRLDHWPDGFFDQMDIALERLL